MKPRIPFDDVSEDVGKLSRELFRDAMERLAKDRPDLTAREVLCCVILGLKSALAAATGALAFEAGSNPERAKITFAKTREMMNHAFDVVEGMGPPPNGKAFH